MIRGVVFDLDGTLLDTEKLYRRFWVEAARQMGYPMKDRHALMIRSMAAEKAERLLRREVCAEFDYHAVRALRREQMEAYIDENGVEPKPQMLETLTELRRMNLRIGLATATPESRARNIFGWWARKKSLMRLPARKWLRMASRRRMFTCWRRKSSV